MPLKSQISKLRKKIKTKKIQNYLFFVQINAKWNIDQLSLKSNNDILLREKILSAEYTLYSPYYLLLITKRIQN